MMLSGGFPLEPKDKVQFQWTTKGFRYLAIIVTPDTLQLFEANYGKLITETKKDLARWEVLPLILVGIIETVRMNTKIVVLVPVIAYCGFWHYF